MELREYRKHVGPFSATMLIAGSMIGSGDRMERVPAPWPVQPWVLAGLVLDIL